MEKGQKEVVLITGCSSGIGAALAETFHRAGYIVYQSARRVEALEGSESRDLRSLQIDVTKPKEIEDSVYKIIEEEGRIDILINNAGYSYFGPLLEVPVDEMKKMYDVNIHGVLRMIHAVAPHMMEREKGLIMNISSISSVVHSIFAAPYCSSKAAVYAISNILRQELNLFGVRVVDVQPGAITSKFSENAKKHIEGVRYKFFEQYKENVERRIEASQKNSMNASVFAEKLLSKVKGKRFNDVDPLIRIGPKSTFYPFVAKFFPFHIITRVAYKTMGIKTNRMPSIVSCRCLMYFVVVIVMMILLLKFLFF